MRLRDKVECTALDGLEREGPHPPPRNNLVPRALQFDREILTVQCVDTYRPLYSLIVWVNHQYRGRGSRYINGFAGGDKIKINQVQPH